MGIAIWGVALYILVSVFSDGAESESRWKIFSMVVGTIVVEATVSRLMPNILGLITYLAISFALLILALIYWIKIDRLSSLKISASYLGLRIAATAIMILF